MSRHSIGLAAVVGIVALAFAASSPRAASVSVEFDGIWPQGFPFPNETYFQGSITFSDAGATDLDPSAIAGGYSGLVTALTFSLTDLLTGDELVLGLGPGSSNGLVVNGYFDSATGETLDWFYISAPLTANAFDFLRLQLDLESSTDVISSDALPSAAQINLLGTHGARIRVFQSHTLIVADVFSHYAVPEPPLATLLMLAVVLAGLPALRVRS